MPLRPLTLVLLVILGCTNTEQPESGAPQVRPSILLVTLDTTRADSIGPDAKGVATPAFNALATRGMRFTQAYATAPQTLPSHASMFTGLYPGGHGVHENGRTIPASQPLLAERLRGAGYRTAAFVSAFALDDRFGLARGFDVYDDRFAGGAAERNATDTTDAALAFLSTADERPLFLWVHYYDPHHPYDAHGGSAADDRERYRREVRFMDEQLGRLVGAFEKRAATPPAIAILADHGEGLGEHGEAQHGNLVYQATMHIPMLLVGPRISAGTSDVTVSSRRIFHTLLDWAGVSAESSLVNPAAEIALGEAMQPFLQYGWQPQVMAVQGPQKIIRAGGIEIYDLANDPAESVDLAARAEVSREARQALRDYPIPVPGAPVEATLDDEARRQLTSLGYVSSNAAPVVRADAPRPRVMTHLFDDLDRAAGLFTAEKYQAAIPLLEQILAADPANVSTALRLGTAHSALGNDAKALAAFRKAESLTPDSIDVQHYLALHYVRAGEWERAAPRLEMVLAATPDRVAALEALSLVRERQGRLADALQLRLRADAIRTPSPADLVTTARIAMELRNTPVAIAAFERARTAQGEAFQHQLELGVLYLDARRFQEARDALDRVPRNHPGFAMALFKRAQVSVLLREPDAARRIDAARAGADETTRNLIAREQLFR